MASRNHTGKRKNIVQRHPYRFLLLIPGLLLMLAISGQVAASYHPGSQPVYGAAAGDINQGQDSPRRFTPEATWSDAGELTTPVMDDQPSATIEPTVIAPSETATDDRPSLPTVAPTVVVRPTNEPTTVKQPPIDATATEGHNPRLEETYCQMDIDDLDDDNPFTYQFSAVNSANIEFYSWSFGDGGVSSSVTATHTYTTTNTFNIVLQCTPLAGFGAMLELHGSITIASSPVAGFDLTPDDTFTGLPPFEITTVNTTIGEALTYAWSLSTSDDPLNAAAVFYTAATENITYTFTETEITAYPATFYFHLVVTDGAGLSSYARRSVVFNAPPPKATFLLSPASGEAPVTVTVNGFDLLEGPLDTWSWDFNEDDVIDATGPGPHTYTYVTPRVTPYLISLDYSGPGGGGTVTKSVGVFPGGDPVTSLFTYELMGSTVGGIEVCFTNNSTGPVATSQWDFEMDGTYDLTSSDQIVCHVYPAEGSVMVRLFVADASGDFDSSSSQAVNVVGEPVASFTVNPGTEITWGTLINLTDTSTGIITLWEWDVTGDLATDYTTENLSNLSLNELGSHTIRLTVTGPGGTSYVEAIIVVERLELTCAFTGSLNVLPDDPDQVYTGNVGNQGGRDITYVWTITGDDPDLPLTYTTANITVPWAAIGYGSFQVTLTASTDDGSACSESKTVTRSWSPLDCTMSNNLPATLYADGGSYQFTATVQNLDDRPVIGYEWYLDGVLQTGITGNILPYTNPTSTVGLPATKTVRYRVLVDNGAGYSPATSECFEEKTFTIQPWPTLQCTSINGTGNPLPGTPDNPGRTYNYTASVSGAAGRTLTYTWSAVNGAVTSLNPRTGNNQATVSWAAAGGSFPPAPVDDSLSVTVSTTNPDGTPASCSVTRNIGVTINRLTCNLPTGDVNPVVNETVAYNTSLVNVYGRPVNSLVWTIEQLSPVTNTWTDVTNPLSLNFPTENAQYRISYAAAVDAAGGLPGDNCTSGWLNIQVYGSGLNFECEGNLTGNVNPTNPAGSYPYTILMDNGNGIELQYDWILTDHTGQDYLLATTTSSADNTITSPGFTLALDQLAPLLADKYTLRVEVQAVDPLMSAHTCTKSLPITAGAITVDYSYTADGWDATAVPINQPICLTNISTMVPGTIDDLNYTWTVSGNAADNSWAVNTLAAQQPGACISFSKPGAYTINLNGITDSTLLTGNKSIIFNVYGLQSILINRTGSNFAPSSQTFTATGTNITGPYAWEFRRIADNALLGTRNGANVNFSFASTGAYRAIVRGTGPLGTTEASLDFNLIAAGGLTAAFTASQYGGIAPMEVCFTDQSISGTPIVLWEWDFDGDGTYEYSYDSASIPASICHTYSVPGMVHPVHLRVTNAGFTDTATNTIRTYTEMESSATFTVQPQGGGYFCFDGIVSPGITITGWDFGDGTTGPGNDPICHNYGASGSYIVTMKITDGSDTGEVIRVIIVDLDDPTTPDIVVSGSCSPDVTASFTITNNGGAMKTPDQVIIRDDAGNVILVAPLQLAGGSSTSYEVSGYVGNVTLSTTDLSLSVSTDCAQPPLLSGGSTCQADGSAVFSITNSGVETAASQPYEVRDALNNLVQSGTLDVPVSGTTDIVVSGVWGPLNFTSSGIQGATTELTVNSDCATPPLLTISHLCQLDGSAVFTITNSSPDTAASQLYEIRDDANTLIQSGTLNVPVNASVDIIVTGEYGLLTFTSVGAQSSTTAITDTSGCGQPPTLSGTADCALDGTTHFVIVNSSIDTAADQPYEIRDGANNLVESGNLTVLAGGSTTVTVSGVYTWLNFTSVGIQGITTELDLSTDCDEPPILTASSTCQADGTAVFTVSNSSTESAADQPYEVHNLAGDLVQSGTLNVPINGSTDVVVTGDYTPLTFTSVGVEGVTTDVVATNDCYEPPILTGSATCALDGVATFTISNTSTESAADQPYEIRDGSNNLIQSGNLNIPINGSTDITLTGVYVPVTLTSVGIQGITTEISTPLDCVQPPTLTASSTCQADGTAVFTVSNSSTESAADQPYEVHNLAGDLVQTGTLHVPINGSTDVIVSNEYSLLTFTSVGIQGVTTEVVATNDCYEPPILTGSATCALDGVATFTISNSSTESAADQPYEIRDGSNNLIQSGNLNIPINGSTDITLTGVYVPVTLTSVGIQGITTDISTPLDCIQPPILTASGTCQANGTAVFTVSNTSTESAADQQYQVQNLAGDLVQSGDLNIPVNSSTSISITDVYGLLTFTSSGKQGSTTAVVATSDCVEPPILTGSATCDAGTAVFTITNQTGTPASQTYTISGSSGSIIQTGTLTIDGNSSQVITATGVGGENLTLTSIGAQGETTELNIATACAFVGTEIPWLSGSSVCLSDGSLSFTVKNESTIPVAQAYTVLDDQGTVLIVGNFDLGGQAAETITVEAVEGSATFITAGDVALTVSGDCSDPTGDQDNDLTGDGGDNEGDDPAETHLLPPLDLTPQFPDATLVPRPDWEAISVGEAVCVDWLLYHTNMTGDWEIFRLGDGGDAQLAGYDPNLSQGRGAQITDMAPTRSPDSQWIAFTSNRDTADQENWELYLASVDNTVIRRMTYNTFAKDIDPVWSPDGRYLAFETDRDGNWELYLFDLASGAELRLTDDAASDINVFWSPDSQQLLFQSDRSGNWQIYRLDLATGDITRLSDGTTEDHDPHYSFDGTQVAFRAYQPNQPDQRQAAIYIMNGDGSGKTLISDPAGSASNHTWSSDDQLIAYQSSLNGDLDVYVYELATGSTRLVTDNAIADYAPTWICSSHTVVFTSDVLVDANIFNTPATPITASPILVDREGNQMTFDPHQDVYPENTPSEENASREGNVPPRIGSPDLVVNAD